MLFDPAQTRALNIPVDGIELAVEITEGQGPTFVWVGGYSSDMGATKAMYLKQQCETWGYRLIRFDYRGCGKSGGAAGVHTISAYVKDTLAIIDQLTDGPFVLIGSSMGGWISLGVMKQIPEKVAGFIGIAAAPDFTEYLRPQDYKDVPQHFIDDGATALVLTTPLAYNGPVELLHALNDDQVPVAMAEKISAHISSNNIVTHIIKDGDHRLSRPQDMELLWQCLTRMREGIIGPVVSMPDE